MLSHIRADEPADKFQAIADHRREDFSGNGCYIELGGLLNGFGEVQKIRMCDDVCFDVHNSQYGTQEGNMTSQIILRERGYICMLWRKNKIV